MPTCNLSICRVDNYYLLFSHANLPVDMLLHWHIFGTLTDSYMQQALTPPFRTPSPSALPATPPPQEDSDAKALVNAASTPSSLQALQPVMAASNNAGAITTPGMAVSPLMADFSPGAMQTGGTQEVLQSFSPATSLLDKSSSTDPPLERLIKKVCMQSCFSYPFTD